MKVITYLCDGCEKGVEEKWKSNIRAIGPTGVQLFEKDLCCRCKDKVYQFIRIELKGDRA